MPQSFAKVALTPKWIGALLLALAVAAIFAALGQWQLDRALTTVGNKHAALPAAPLNQLTEPGLGFPTKLNGRQVTAKVISAQSLGLVANRHQNGETGYWQLSLASLDNGNKLIIAQGFSTNPTETNDLPTGSITGSYLPSEEPQTQQDKLFQTLSVQQLINQTDKTITNVYPGFVARTDAGQPKAIAIQTESERTEINALNAFYAAEWALFAGFAVFLWWRLVQDERLGLRGER